MYVCRADTDGGDVRRAVPTRAPGRTRDTLDREHRRRQSVRVRRPRLPLPLARRRQPTLQRTRARRSVPPREITAGSTPSGGKKCGGP